MKQAIIKMNTVIKTAALALAFACTSALADNGYQYLYWYVDETEADEPIAFAYATLKDGRTGTVIDALGADSYLSSETLGLTAGSATAPVGYASDLGAYANSANYFYIELFDENDVGLGASSYLSYSSLFSLGYLGTNDTGTNVEHAWKVSAFMVPEPTSGMLFLLGIAALSLRRKRK